MKMKHLLATILLALLVVACGGQETAPEQPPVVTDVPAQPTATLIPVEQPTEAPAVEPTPEPTLPPPVIVDEGEPAEEPAPPAEEEAPSAPPAEMPDNVFDRSTFGYGVQSHATIGDPGYTMEVIANQLGINWVKVQLRWADVERAPGEYDLGIWDIILEEAAKRDLFVMLSIVTAPEWSRAVGDQHGPPDDYNLYYGFLSMLLDRYPGQVHAIEVWNEQNLDREWQTANGVAPVDYIEFLKGAYGTIKGIDSDIIVISGALSPTGAHDPNKITFMNDLIWMDEAVSLGMLDYTDCVGVHHNGYNLPPDVGYDETERAGSIDDNVFKGPWGNPHPSWSFKTTLDAMSDKTQAVKPDMKICVTEFGWPSSEGYDEIPVGFEFALDNTLEEQATYIVQAFQQMRDSGDVMLAFLFNFDFGNKGGGPTDDPVPYSLIDTNGIPRPSFSAVSAMEKTP